MLSPRSSAYTGNRQEEFSCADRRTLIGVEPDGGRRREKRQKDRGPLFSVFPCLGRAASFTQSLKGSKDGRTKILSSLLSSAVKPFSPPQRLRHSERGRRTTNGAVKSSGPQKPIRLQQLFFGAHLYGRNRRPSTAPV